MNKFIVFVALVPSAFAQTTPPDPADSSGIACIEAIEEGLHDSGRLPQDVSVLPLDKPAGVRGVTLFDDATGHPTVIINLTYPCGAAYLTGIHEALHVACCQGNTSTPDQELEYACDELHSYKESAKEGCAQLALVIALIQSGAIEPSEEFLEFLHELCAYINAIICVMNSPEAVAQAEKCEADPHYESCRCTPPPPDPCAECPAFDADEFGMLPTCPCPI